MARIILTYFATIVFVLLKIRQPFVEIDPISLGRLFAVLSIVVVLFNIGRILDYVWGKYIITYTVFIMISYAAIQSAPFSTVFSWCIPFFIIGGVKPKEYKYYKPLKLFLILVFLTNIGVAYYEMVTKNYIMPPDKDDITLYSQAVMFDSDKNAFRSFALFRHPLANANIMAFMSFVVYFSNCIEKKWRTSLFVLGMSSLVCFNARAAILISAVLVILVFYEFIKFNSRYIFVRYVLFVIVMLLLVSQFEYWGGRFLSSDMLDESAKARIISIQSFFAIPFVDLLVGGNELIINENGYLATIAEFGLIIGGMKIFIEIFLAFKLLGDNTKLIVKLIIVSSVILIGSTNNNLSSPTVYPLYILSLCFIYQPSHIRGVKKIKKYSDKTVK